MNTFAAKNEKTPKKITFNMTLMKAHGIEKIEFKSYEDKILKGLFFISEKSKLLENYVYQDKTFNAEKQLYQSHNPRKDCRKRNRINVILANDSFDILISFYPITKSISSNTGIKIYPEYELRVKYDEIMSLLQGDTALKDDSQQSQKHLIIENEFFEIRNLKAIYVPADKKKLSDGPNTNVKEIEVSCEFYRKQMRDMYVNFFYCKTLKKSEFITKEITKTKFYIYNTEVKSIAYISIEVYNSTYGNARKEEIFKNKILVKDILDNHTIKKSTSPVTADQLIESINNTSNTKQEPNKNLGPSIISKDISKIKSQIKKIENERLKTIETENKRLKEDNKDLKNRIEVLETQQNNFVQKEFFIEEIRNFNTTIQSLQNQTSDEKLSEKMKEIFEKIFSNEIEQRINNTLDNPKSDAMQRVKKTIRAVIKKELKNQDTFSKIEETEVNNSPLYKLFLEKKQELEKFIMSRLNNIEHSPITLSSSIQEFLKNIELVKNDFDIIYPDGSLVDSVNDGMKKIGIDINHLIIECSGINQESLINSMFQFNEELTEKQITDMFEDVTKQLNKQIRIYKKRTIETEEDVIKALAIIAQQLYDLIETNKRQIYDWHEDNNDLPQALSNRELEVTIQELYKKSGLEQIYIREGIDLFDSQKHHEMEQKKDQKYNNKIIVQELSPGYINFWTKDIIKKAGVVVNYRF